MKQLTVLAVLSLCCTSLTSCTGDCHHEGPENCNIVPREYPWWNRKVCSWSLGSNFKVYKSNSYWFVGLTPNRQEGKLTSRTACSTGGQTHCLRFWYLFQQDNIIDLSVSIQYDRNNEAESPMWIMSSSYDWDLARVLISTVRNFTVVFKAKRRPAYVSSSASVFIDVISYSKSPCQFGLYPNDAQLSTTTASSTTHETFDEQTSAESNVGLIVGVIVAVLIVIIVVMAVLLVVFRRKNIFFWKACGRKKQPKEHFHVNASHNVAYSLNAADQACANGEARTSTHSSTNHNLESLSASKPSEPVHALVNKPQKAKQENSPSVLRKPRTVVSELCNEDAENFLKAAGTEYQNISPTVAKQKQGGNNNSPVPLPVIADGCSLAQPQNSNSVYHVLEKGRETANESVQHVPIAGSTTTAPDEDEEYNSLAFDTKSCAETKSIDEEKSEEATGGVYSHLNEGDGDTYNEVHREKRAEVIDGVYSHIK